jgi:tRNA-splicing ligase RtcB
MPILGVLDNKEHGLKVPVKVWSDLKDIEESAQKQLRNVARMPFIFKHVAVMPDVHYGIGATVGSVIATKGAVIPAAVGVDIGCGMMAVKTPFKVAEVADKAPEIRNQIERSVPVGFGENSKIRKTVEDWPGWQLAKFILNHEQSSKATNQLGSLGGGNHFIELCQDTDGAVWIMLHSGSRGVGNQLARIHIDKAKGIMKRMLIDLPDPDLAYFAQQTPEYDAYMRDLNWCQDYALQNRIEMMDRVIDQLCRIVRPPSYPMPRLVEVNCHHNYSATENHFGENVLVTRKGAVRARVGDMGIIPGSMGTGSFIVKGLGNPESFMSCSHGAGRKMSRTAARKAFTAEDLVKQTEGVECRKDAGVVDEIPGAYKNINEVMTNQSDLVEIVASLKQFLCVKG